MREIKFRAWDKIEDKMRTDILSIDIGFEVSNCVYFINSGHRRVNDLILMQYTGIKDREGVEIYEGDIVKSDNGHNGVVKYFDNLTWDGGGRHPGFYCTEWLQYGDLSHYLDFENCKVVGNIYTEARNEKT
jgi:uncharacterized phage protein (TIGR01671 family)